MFSSSPFVFKPVSVRRVMLQVCLALLPALVAYAVYVTPAILLQVVIATLSALGAEALMLRLRGKPLAPFLGDGSAVVTAWLIALTFPPLAPWWLIVVGVFFAIVIAKHLYGGLGQNPFNPAMIAFAVCIVSFPALMSQWPNAGLNLPVADQIMVVLGQNIRPDAWTGATPLDSLKTALRMSGQEVNVTQLLTSENVFGFVAGNGWEWVSLAYLLGGLWMWQRRLITWHAPLGFLSAMILISGALWLSDSQQYVSPLFHLFSGGTMIGAFFIATDPVSGCTTPKGKILFGLGAGLLAYLIRVFGAYPDGVAFGILLMNLSAPVIDLLTQPAIFGKRGDRA